MSNAIGCDLFLYADDSALLASSKTVSEIEANLQNNLIYLSSWLEENVMSLFEVIEFYVFVGLTDVNFSKQDSKLLFF